MPQPVASPANRSPVSSSMAPIKPENFGFAEARHLLWRAGFGGTPSQIETLVGWGPEKSVDYLLAPEKVPFDGPAADAFDKDIIRPASEEERRMAQQARRSRDEETLAKIQLEIQRREREDRGQMREIQKWWLTRMIETPRPLEERMTLFWHGHFATSFRSIENSYHMFRQNQMFRQNALGNFGELLFGIIRDPAMLAYLNNNQSRKGRPNENLARELMELFSLGVGNYSEDDIKEGARALTGYTFTDDEFVFQKDAHDQNPKKILGRSGRMDGDDFVRLILQHPACSRFMARKLYAYFGADIPPLDATDNDRNLDRVSASVIADLASAMRSARFEIKPVLRRLFLSQHFYDPRIMGQQIKSPVQLVVGAVRSLLVPTRDLGLLVDALDLMGQKIFEPPSVKGWNGGRSWINTSTIYVRQNIMAFLLTGKKPAGYDAMASEERYDPTLILEQLDGNDPQSQPDTRRMAEALLRFTIGSAPEDAVRLLAAAAEDESSGSREDRARRMLLLITAMPEYQLC